MAEMKTSISQSEAARRCPASSPHRGRGNQASAIGPLRKWRSGRRSRGHVFRSAPCGQIAALAGRTMTTAAEPIAGRSYPRIACHRLAASWRDGAGESPPARPTAWLG